jgi:hypothetical protein
MNTLIESGPVAIFFIVGIIIVIALLVGTVKSLRSYVIRNGGLFPVDTIAYHDSYFPLKAAFKHWKLTTLVSGVSDSTKTPRPTVAIAIEDESRMVVEFTSDTLQHAREFAERVPALMDYLDYPNVRFLKAIEPKTIRIAFETGESKFLNGVYPYPISEVGQHIMTIPLGRTEEGDEVRIPVNCHTLVAGKTGGGKGSVMWSIFAGLAGRKDVAIHGVDLAGGVEFNMNRDVFTGPIITKAPDFANLVDALYEEMNTRLASMVFNKWRDMPISASNPRRYLAIDEAADIADWFNDKAFKLAFPDTERQFDELGRKARKTGIFIIAALQNPNVGTFPWARHFPQKVMLKMSQSQQINAIGQASLDTLDLSTVPATARGIAVVQDEQGEYQAVKVYYPDDEIISNLPMRGVAI